MDAASGIAKNATTCYDTVGDASRMRRGGAPPSPPRKEGRATINQTPSTALVPARERAIECARIAEDNRGRDVVVLEVTGIVSWVDYLVIVTGTSRRQMKTVADEIESRMIELGEKKTGIEGYDNDRWMVLDYADVVIHIFNEQSRDFFQLEHLWDDAPRVPWQRPAPAVETESPSSYNHGIAQA